MNPNDDLVVRLPDLVPLGRRELVRLARSYRTSVLADMANRTEPRKLAALHRELSAVEEYFGGAPVRLAGRSAALRILAGAREQLEDRLAAARNGELVALTTALVPVRPTALASPAAMPADPLAAHLDRLRYCRQSLTEAFVRDVTERFGPAALPARPIDPCRTEDLVRAAAAGVRFGTVYADPPWQYENRASRGAAEDHYPTLSADEIASLPVGPLAAEDSHLHLWTTNAFLADAMRVMDAWGFTFKSVFVWAKPQLGMGNYWRVSHEFLLLGTRGRGRFRDRGQPSWRVFGRTRHSAKPAAVRRLVEKVSPGPYLELFARTSARGWVAWGNEIGREEFDTALDSTRVVASGTRGVAPAGRNSPAPRPGPTPQVKTLELPPSN